MPLYDKQTAFITLKDHKEDFPRIKKYRLINPAKSHIGKLSKTILQKINDEIRSKTKLIQWKNSIEVTNWFKNIQDKQKQCFVNFDIVEYYPSITKDHLLEALTFAEKYVDLSEEDKSIIFNACKTIMFHDDNIWRKKDVNDLFDIPMGSYHGAEICDLVGLVILERLSQIFPPCSYGLYRDDGLGFTPITNPSSLERLKKQITSTFSKFGFKITIEVGKMKSNFLDITLDLANDSYSPYRKPNSEILYIHNKSNHPGHIKKGITPMINKRLCALSKSGKEFDKCKDEYESALRRSGFNTKLKFEAQENKTKRKRKRKRDCLYF